MGSTRHERVRALFLEVCELDAAGQAAILERECAGDAGLRAEIDALLDHDRAAGLGGATEQLGDRARVIAQELGQWTGVPADGSDPASGTVKPTAIAGYRIVRELGSGGAGTVYEAFQERMNRPVALKLLSRVLSFSDRAVRRFEQEAWITGKLDHPNIVKVFERGTWEDSSFFSMEFIRGGSAHDLLDRLRATGRDERFGLEFGTRAYIEWVIRQIALAARALAHTHERGVVHRDIKPMNLLLDLESATVKVADFGIAIDEEITRQTSEGRVLGTLRYMAPEQLLGKNREIDGRTDIYALGVTLFELLTLDYPYRGETFERYMQAVLHEAARKPRTLNDRVGRDLEIVVGKALEKDRRDRYATAAEFADDLDNVLHFRPIRARPPSTFVRIGKWVRRKPVHAALLLTLTIGLPLGGWIGYRAVEGQRHLMQVRIELLVEMIRQNGGDDPDKVIELTDQMFALAPNYWMIFEIRANTFHRLSRLEKDQDKARRYMQQAFTAADRLIELLPQRSSPHKLKAHLLSSTGRQVEAEAELNAARGLLGGDEVDLYSDARMAMNEGDYQRAEELFSRVLVLRQRNDVLEWRAEAREKQGNLEGAIDDYLRLLKADPLNAYPRRRLAGIYIVQERFEEGVLHLARAGVLAPDDVEVPEVASALFVDWGRARLREQDREGALDQFIEAERRARGALRLELGSVAGHLNLGTALIEQYRLSRPPDQALLDGAIEHYEAGGTLARTSTNHRIRSQATIAMMNICDALIVAAKLDEAMPVCLKAVELAPLEPNAHYNLAALYALLGRKEEALAELERDFDLGDREHIFLAGDAWFASLRDDPDFQTILRRMREDSPQ